VKYFNVDFQLGGFIMWPSHYRIGSFAAGELVAKVNFIFLVAQNLVNNDQNYSRFGFFEELIEHLL